MCCIALLCPTVCSRATYDRHKTMHACGAKTPCTTEAFRAMQNDDWVKFGHTIWAKYTGRKQGHILKRYKQAWTEIYRSAPVLENGGPGNFLNDSKYTCVGPVPWGQHHEARFSSSLTVAEPLVPTPEPQPSTSTATSPAAQASTASNIDDEIERKIREGLENVEFDSISETEFPKIKNGLLDGFIQYLKP